MRAGTKLKPGESVDELGLGGYGLIQNRKLFSFGTDAVLLSRFTRICKGDTVVDLCSGTGIIPVLLCALTEAKTVYGVEIQPVFHEMAERNAVLNCLEGRFIPLNLDLRDMNSELKSGNCDAVTVNPPYKKAGSGLRCADDVNTAARHEVLCTLEDCVSTAARLLRPSGRFYMIHRPDRLADIFALTAKYKLEPKKMRLVYPAADKRPVFVMTECMKCVNPGGLEVMPPLLIYGGDGEFSDEMRSMYGKSSGTAGV